MQAMVFNGSDSRLVLTDLPPPRPDEQQVLLRVHACAVCRTDLHIVDRELTNPKLPLIPGHEIIGVVIEKGRGVDRFAPGDRVGVRWLGWTCGVCAFCRGGRENLCDRARFTGYQIEAKTTCATGQYGRVAVVDRFTIDMADAQTPLELVDLGQCASGEHRPPRTLKHRQPSQSLRRSSRHPSASRRGRSACRPCLEQSRYRRRVVVESGFS